MHCAPAAALPTAPLAFLLTSAAPFSCWVWVYASNADCPFCSCCTGPAVAPRLTALLKDGSRAEEEWGAARLADLQAMVQIILSWVITWGLPTCLGMLGAAAGLADLQQGTTETVWGM